MENFYLFVQRVLRILVEVLKYLIENDNLIKLNMIDLYEKVKKFIEEKEYNILSKTITNEKIQLFVQTKDGLEELIINNELFISPYFSQSINIYKNTADSLAVLNTKLVFFNTYKIYVKNKYA